MAPNRPRFSSHGVVAGLALLATLVATPRAWSQHTPDPYNYVGEYNRGYEPYMFPTLPNEQGFVPGQAAMMGRAGIRQSNQFRNYLQGLNGSEGDGFLGAPEARVGLSNPYYQAYRQYDRDYGRTYAPNQEADRSYYEDLRTRHEKILKYQEASREKYADYVRERDPTRRPPLPRISRPRPAVRPRVGRTPRRADAVEPDRLGRLDAQRPLGHRDSVQDTGPVPCNTTGTGTQRVDPGRLEILPPTSRRGARSRPEAEPGASALTRRIRLSGVVASVVAEHPLRDPPPQRADGAGETRGHPGHHAAPRPTPARQLRAALTN